MGSRSVSPTLPGQGGGCTFNLIHKRGHTMSTTYNIARFLFRVCAVSFLLSVSVVSILAQTNRGSIKGTVTDPNGAIVQNASVTVTNVGTNAERTVSSGDDGTYEVPLLEPGTYKVTIKAATFGDTVRDNVIVQTASTEVVDVTLTVGGVGDVVTVKADAVLVQTETSERGSVVS